MSLLEGLLYLGAMSRLTKLAHGPRLLSELDLSDEHAIQLAQQNVIALEHIGGGDVLVRLVGENER